MRKVILFGVATTLCACGPSVAQLTLDPTTAALAQKGETAVLKAQPKDKEGNVVLAAVPQIVWASSNAAVATVDGGKVTAVKSGSADITAKISDQTATAKVTVAIPAKIVLDPATAELAGPGKTVKLNAKVTDDAGQDMPATGAAWTSSDPKVASVQDGVVTAIGPGQATIGATLGAFKGETAVTVKPTEVASLSIDPDKFAFPKAGATNHFNASARDGQGAPVLGAPVSWSSSDEKVVTISDTGDATAVKRGKAKITAKSGEKTAEIEVTVK